MAISGNQLRAARSLAGWDQMTLASEAGVGIATIRKMEARGPQHCRIRVDTLERLAHALRVTGVEFIEKVPGQLGVQLTVPNEEFLSNMRARPKRRKRKVKD